MTTTVPTAYREPHALPTGCLRTCRGIVIGGAIPPRLPAMDAHDMRMQAALLETRHLPAPQPLRTGAQNPGNPATRAAHAVAAVARAAGALVGKAWALA